MAEIIYGADGRAVGIKKGFWDLFLGKHVDETSDSFILKEHGVLGIGGGETRILKSRLNTNINIHRSENESNIKISVAGKQINVDELPPEVRKKLGL